MSTGLGDYIHYHADSYNTYGINEKKEGGPTFTQSLNFAHNELNVYRSQASQLQGDFQGLKQALNYLTSGEESALDTSKINSAVVKLLDQQRQIVEDAVKSISPNAFMTADGQLINPDTVSKVKSLNANQSRISFDRIKAQLSNIPNMINALGNMSKKGKISWSEASSVIYQLSSIKSNFEKLIVQESKGKGEFFTNKSSGAQVISLYNTLEIIYDLYFSDINENSRSFLGEALVGAVTSVGANVVDKAKKDIEKQLGIVGSNGSKRTYSNLAAGMISWETMIDKLNAGKDGKKNSTWEFVNESGGLLQTVKPAQDTVDVIMDASGLSQGMQQFLGLETTLKASVKNYSKSTVQQKGISIISKTPLLALLQLVNTDFGNHYLNILSVQKGSANASLDDANRVIKKALAIRGLLGVNNSGGGVNTSNLADVFIINIGDGKTANWQVYSMANLLTRIFQSPDEFIKTDDLPASIFQDWIGEEEKNNWDEAKQRVTSVLLAAHAKKISAHLSNDFFKFI